MARIASPPGVFDILPECEPDEWRSSHVWTFVEAVMRETALDFGYREVRTPIFERTELFERGVGEGTDLVSKEMYTFKDKGERSLSLRPEGTAPVIRAFVEHSLHAKAPIHKLFYIGPMFRYERSQAGRYRQHHQFGAEAIGNDTPEQDVEMIDMVYTLYQRLGLQNLQIHLNSIGDSESRQKFKKALKDYLRSSLASLSEDSQRRFETNPLRILDSKDPKDREIVANAPSVIDYLSEGSRKHFEAVQGLLEELQIPYQVNPLLVRGLDYYNQTVFEIIAGELGAQNSIGGGGRYDGLVKELGGPDLPAIGFATGIERIIHVLLKQGITIPNPHRVLVFLIPLGDEAKKRCFSLLHKLREKGIAAQMDFSGRKLGKVMQYANQIGAQFVTVIGDEELKTNKVELKEMSTGETRKVPLSYLSRILRLELKGENFMRIWDEMQQPFEAPGEAEFFAKKLEDSISQTKQLTEDLQKAMESMKGML